MAAKFEIRSPEAGQYRWVLVSQGRTLATGPAYARKGLALKAIDSFRMAAIAAPVDDQTRAPARTAAGKVARVAGRVAAKAVVKGARAVEKVEETAVKAPAAAKKTVKRAATKVEKVTAKTAKVVKPARPAKKSPAPRKRTSPAG